MKKHFFRALATLLLIPGGLILLAAMLLASWAGAARAQRAAKRAE